MSSQKNAELQSPPLSGLIPAPCLRGDTQIKYRFREHAVSGFVDELKRLIEELQPHAVCDIGGGARPWLPLSVIHDNGLDYTVLDISSEELAKAPAGYQKKRQMDICEPGLALDEQFDFVFSKMLAEHVRDGEEFHKNVFQMLKPGGVAFHLFPTLFSPPFVANVLMPEFLSTILLRLVGTWDRSRKGNTGKFPAYYSWCRGPTKRQFRRFQSLGYEVVEYVGFFGHGYYGRVAPLQHFADSIARLLVKHPLPMLTSFVYLTLKKPLLQ